MQKTSRGEKQSIDRSSMIWVVPFVILVGFFYWLDQHALFQKTVVDPLSVWTAKATVFVLSLLGLSLNLDGTTIMGPFMRLEIARSCSGSFVFLMFAAAVIPFPAPWQSRLKGILAGLITLILVNLLRTSLIVLMVSRFPQSLWTFHIIVGQVLVIAAMIGLFLWWARGGDRVHVFPTLKNNRAILGALALFCAAYVVGYILYGIFLNSALGLFIKSAMEAQTSWILNMLNAHVFKMHITAISAAPVRLVEGCLSSPVVVLMGAAVAAWPAKWWKRVLVILMGFIPFFYIYHLLRAVLISMTLTFQGKDGNLVYNFYGQAFLVLFVMAGLGYYRCSVQKIMVWRAYLFKTVISMAVALSAAILAGWPVHMWPIPYLTGRFSGTAVLSFNPEQALSTMLPVQIFIWLTLLGPTPGMGFKKKCLMGLAGILAASALYILCVSMIETFHMAPHKGLFKLFVIFLPMAVYGGSFLRRRR